MIQSDSCTKVRRAVCVARNVMDECQYAMPLSFFKATYFETEEEALQHKKETGSNTNPHFSEKLSKYYLVEPNKLTSVIEKSIKDTVDFLKLKVDLGFEFEVGKNWADCH